MSTRTFFFTLFLTIFAVVVHSPLISAEPIPAPRPWPTPEPLPGGVITASTPNLTVGVFERNAYNAQGYVWRRQPYPQEGGRDVQEPAPFTSLPTSESSPSPTPSATETTPTSTPTPSTTETTPTSTPTPIKTATTGEPTATHHPGRHHQRDFRFLGAL